MTDEALTDAARAIGGRMLDAWWVGDTAPSQAAHEAADRWLTPLISAAKAQALRDAADDLPSGGSTDSYWDGQRVEYVTYETKPNDKSPQKWLRDRAEKEGGQ